MVELQALGWDNGFGYEKLFTLVNSKKYKEEKITEEEIKMGLTAEEKRLGIKKCRFPSIHMILLGAGALNISFSHKYSYDKMNLIYKGKDYLIGNYAIQQDPKQGGIKNFNVLKYKDETEIAKLCAGLALMFPGDEKIIVNNLVIGTSLKTLRKDVIKEAIDTYKNKTLEFSYPILISTGDLRKRNVTVEIKNVNLVPQGIGTVNDLIFDINGRLADTENRPNLLKLRYGIIDIGNNTVDGFIREGFDTHIQGSEFFMEYGTSDIYKNIARKLSLENRGNQIEMLHTQGMESIYHNGQDISFSKELAEEYERFASELHSMTIDPWNRYIGTVQIIIVAGGCAHHVKNYLSKAFDPIKVYVPDNPQFSNARGYFKFGIFLMRGENQ